MGTVTVSFGMAERVSVPFGDALTPTYFRPKRWEESETVGHFTTERGRERIVNRTLIEIVTSRGWRVLANTTTKRPSVIVYYIDNLAYANIRFAEIRWDHR
jgi:hypothetical protein